MLRYFSVCCVNRSTLNSFTFMTQECRQTPILQVLHICHIHPKEENHILSGKSDTLADLFSHICLKVRNEKELRS